MMSERKDFLAEQVRELKAECEGLRKRLDASECEVDEALRKQRVAQDECERLGAELEKTQYTVHCFAARMRQSGSHDLLKEVRAAEQEHDWLREDKEA